MSGFLNPLLAFGALLALVPLVIHLLNRRRYKPMPWAAMRFVMAAYKRTRRRVELENLLLLLLRMAGIACLALAVARPFTSGESPLSALTENRRDLLLALDTSASTGYRDEGDPQSVYERILARAKEVVNALRTGRGDRVCLLFAGAQARNASWMSPEKALAVLSSASAPTHEALDWTGLLGALHALVEEEAAGTGQSAVEVRFLSDLQKTSFHEKASPLTTEPALPDEAGLPLARELLEALQGYGVRILVEDHGSGGLQPPNLALSDLRLASAPSAAGQPLEVLVTLNNYSSSTRSQVRVALELNGERLPSQRVDLLARGSAEVLFPIQVERSGVHTLSAVLEGDRLPLDDVRSAVIEVPPPLRILVVNGAGAARIVDDEVGYLMAVLESPTADPTALVPEVSGFDPQLVTPEELALPELALDRFDVIFLANVSASFLSPQVIEALEGTIARGAGLILSVGDRWTGAGTRFAWNEKLFRPDGSGLLPAEIRRHISVSARREGYFRIADFDANHGALRFFGDDLWKPFLTQAPVYEFLACTPLGDARVLASLDDQDKSPLLIERNYDRGRVYLWNTTIDRAWTFLPESPRTFIPLVHELLRHAGTRQARDYNLAPGEPIALEVDSFPRNPVLVRPDPDNRVALAGEPEELVNGRWRMAPISGEWTERVGLYRLELEGQARAAFAVQLDPKESDLARLSAQELAGYHPALVYRNAGEDDTGGTDDPAGSRGELWRWIALAALIAVVLESLFGAWLGWKRRMA